MKRVIFPLWVLIIFLLGLGLGVGLGLSEGKKRADARLQAALEKVQRFFPATSEIHALSGKVAGIREGVITFQAFSIPNPLVEIPLRREVVVDPGTQLFKMVPKDPTLFRSEVEAYQRYAASFSLTPAEKLRRQPRPVVEKPISLTGLRVGDQILVESAENIKTKVRFKAQKIVIVNTLPRPSLSREPLR